MSDDASGGSSHDTSHHAPHHSSDDSSPWQPHHRSSGSLPSLHTLRRAARWETFAILVVLIALAAIFS